MSEADVRDAFHRQTIACRALGSPLTADICDILSNAIQSDQGEVARRILGWQGDPSSRTDAVPLRLCGGLHALVLTGRDTTLAQSYKKSQPTADILLTALKNNEKYLLKWLESPPQTNEVGRAAVIIAAARFAAKQYNLPIRALELGASAGLNLNFQRFHLLPQGAPPPSGMLDTGLDTGKGGQVTLCPQWQGEIPEAEIRVAKAEGVDLRPLDPHQDKLRLRDFAKP